jgi:hypothetical protein
MPVGEEGTVASLLSLLLGDSLFPLPSVLAHIHGETSVVMSSFSFYETPLPTLG